MIILNFTIWCEKIFSHCYIDGGSALSDFQLDENFVQVQD